MDAHTLKPRGYDAWLPMVSLQVRVSTGSPHAGWPGRYKNVKCCGGLSMVFLQLKKTLELFVERKGICSRFWISIYL